MHCLDDQRPQGAYFQQRHLARLQRDPIKGKSIYPLSRNRHRAILACQSKAHRGSSCGAHRPGRWLRGLSGPRLLGILGDTERNPAFWKRLNQLDVAMLVIETAFSNRESELARRSLHLSPQVLASELENIKVARSFPIYITHTKPAETELIMAEIQRFDQSEPLRRHVSHDIHWLRAGQVFEI
jgi:ribonuclease BN (tRNA processing enzyme)